MPIGRQPPDPRVVEALPRIHAYMKWHNHQQKDVVRLTGLTQPQVSKFLAGERRRVTNVARLICRYAGIELEMASGTPTVSIALSQSARRLLDDNPHAAELMARLIEAMVPVLSSMAEPVTEPKEVA